MKVIPIVLDGSEMFIVNPDEETNNKITAESSHSIYCLDRFDVLSDLSSFKNILQKMNGEKINSVVEFFGGSGWHGLMIQKIIKPNRHILVDLDKISCLSAKKSLKKYEGVKVIHKNSYEIAKIIEEREIKYDFSVNDFNNFSFMKMFRDKELKRFIKNMFLLTNEYAEITDSAIFGLVRFGNKNLDAYSKLFKCEIKDYTDYYKIVSKYFYKWFGFGLYSVIVPKGKMTSLCIYKKNYQGKFEVEFDQTMLELKK